MKILMAVGDGCSRMVNPYVQSLAEGLRDAGHRVDVDAASFWNSTCDYDVVHVHWPQALFGWDLGGITAGSVERCRRRLEQLKSGGAAVCYTRHNVGPHANENPHAAELYRLFEQESDVVLHMGRRAAGCCPMGRQTICVMCLFRIMSTTGIRPWNRRRRVPG